MWRHDQRRRRNDRHDRQRTTVASPQPHKNRVTVCGRPRRDSRPKRDAPGFRDVDAKIHAQAGALLVQHDDLLAACAVAERSIHAHIRDSDSRDCVTIDRGERQDEVATLAPSSFVDQIRGSVSADPKFPLSKASPLLRPCFNPSRPSTSMRSAWPHRWPTVCCFEHPCPPTARSSSGIECSSPCRA